uniref:RNA polymerase Ispecific transcription initiation factor rrn3 putative n=1 Tax=Albugo laibachii Nc14 TaxID=890382 RepID=F0X282_9STRA|nr:RNA polymerase Ispecific transcription initiation factor rrn3 putative [Albugo laibachii Nc14]|eukprot:CCA27960.1 RNA polymerase Ispecific transcription initiation factor rrn3 putative [Albugo laibachii Nc14]
MFGDDRQYISIYLIPAQFGIISICFCDTNTLHACEEYCKTKDFDCTDLDEIISSRSEYVHEALQRVLTTIPTSANVLISILSKSFPHAGMAAIVQVAYVRNLMEIADFAPALKEQIIALTLDRLIQIGVEIKVDETGMDTAEEAMFTTGDFLDENLSVGDAGDIDEMDDKLGKVILVMFEYLGQSSGQGGENDSVTMKRQTYSEAYLGLLAVYSQHTSI